MYYQIRLPLACFIILAYCFWYYHKKKRLPTRTSRIFELMCYAALIHLAAAVVTEYTVNNRDKVSASFNYVWHVVFLISVTCMCALILYYQILYIERGSGRRQRAGKRILLTVWAAGVIAQIVLPISYIDTPQGSYSLGPKAYSLYVVVIYVLAMLLLNTVFYRKIIGWERSRVLLMSVAIFVIASSIQIAHPYMLLTGPAMTLIVLGIMVNTEDAHLYVDYQSGLYNDLGCRELLQEHLLSGRPFQLGVYVFLGNDVAVANAMQFIERKLPEKKTRLICGIMNGNVLLVQPMSGWSTTARLPEPLPLPEQGKLSVKFLARRLDCGPDDSLEQILGRVRDLKDRFEEDILHRDELTGVLRRDAFIRQVEYLILQRRPFSLVMVDLDNFKSINDSFGHGVGDEVLKFTADTFRSALRGDDIICRMGGDEFSLVLSGVGEPEQAREIMERITGQLGAARILPDKTRGLYLSAGIKIYRPEDNAPSFQELYAEADAALYHTKHHGKKGISFAGNGYSPETV